MPGAMLLAMLLKGSLHECHAGPCCAATCSCCHAPHSHSKHPNGGHTLETLVGNGHTLGTVLGNGNNLGSALGNTHETGYKSAAVPQNCMLARQSGLSLLWHGHEKRASLPVCCAVSKGLSAPFLKSCYYIQRLSCISVSLCVSASLEGAAGTHLLSCIFGCGGPGWDVDMRPFMGA